MVLRAAINLGSRGGGKRAAALGEPGAQDGGGETNKIGGILENILKVLKPITDLIGLMVAILAFGLIKGIQAIVEGVKGIIDWVKTLWEITKEKFTQLVEWIKGLPERIWEFLKGLGAIIWEFMKQLPEKIWEFIKELPEKIWEFIKGLGEIIWNWIKIGFQWIREKVIEIKDKYCGSNPCGKLS